ncbi:hypothetical protein ACFX5K_00105 [Rickettsiales bacterium LUAb2]
MATNINLSGISLLNDPSFNFTKDLKTTIDQDQQLVTTNINASKQAANSLISNVVSGVATAASGVVGAAGSIFTAPINAIKGIIDPQNIVATIINLLLQNDKIVALLTILNKLETIINNYGSNITSSAKNINQQSLQSIVPNNLIPKKLSNNINDFTGTLADYKQANIANYLDNNINDAENSNNNLLQLPRLENSSFDIQKNISSNFTKDIISNNSNITNIASDNNTNNASSQDNIEEIIPLIVSINSSLLEISNTIRQYSLAYNKKHTSNINNNNTLGGKV